MFAGLPPSSSDLAERKNVVRSLLLQNGGANIEDPPTSPLAARVTMSESPAAPAETHGRAGRNLPAAIGIGVGLGAYVVLSLVYLKPAFVVLVAVALVLAAVELHEALKSKA